MKIGVIHGFIYGGGGIQRTLDVLLDALNETNHDVTLYTISKTIIPYEKIKVKSLLPFSVPFFGLYQRAMESKLISKAQDEDVLIQASGGFGVPANDSQKIIIYCHDDLPNELENPETKYKGIWSIYYKVYYSMVKGFFKNIGNLNIYLVSNSRYVHDSISDRFKKDSKVIYPPVQLDGFSVTTKNTILTMGRYTPEKNLKFAIDVFDGLNDTCDIIGNTETRANIIYYEKLKSKLHKDSRVHLHNNLPRDKRVEMLNGARVYFHARPETFGITVVEGIAAGAIPIVPDNSAHKETVPFPELRYTPNDVTDARKKIQMALDGKFDHLLSDLAKNIQKFDQENFKRSFISILDNI